MRRTVTLAYGLLAAVLVLAVVVQVFLAGLGIFGAKSFNPHKDFGFILHLVTILVFLFAVAGPRSRADIGLGLGLFVLTTVQVSLAGDSVREDAPGLAALHPVLALFVLGMAALIAWRTLGTRSRPAATAGR